MLLKYFSLSQPTQSSTSNLRLGLFEATSVNCTSSLACLKESYVSDGTQQVSFKANSRKNYFLVVSDDESSGGAFTLSLVPAKCVENDSCRNATTVSPPFFDESTTEFSSISSNYSSHNVSTTFACHSLSGTFGYNYYRVTDERDSPICLSVSLFSRTEGAIFVMRGDCTNLSCYLQENVYPGSTDRSFKFLAEPNISYTILVGLQRYFRVGAFEYILAIEVSLAV